MDRPAPPEDDVAGPRTVRGPGRKRGLTVAAAGRRYVLLTALRWLPVGISAPVTVLLAAARGLSPADIGLVVAVCSAVTLLLELPTGGLADAVGPRPVLVLSGLLTVAGLLVMTVADGVLLFAVAWALHGAGRALDSGPLEAWYVDAVAALDPDADITPALSRAAAADGAGLAVGAVLGGLVPSLAGGADADALAAPLLLAAALGAGSVAAVALLVVPLPVPRAGGAGALRAGVRAAPAVVRDTARLAAADPALRLLLAVSLLAGAVLTTLELLVPLRFAELTGDAVTGGAVSGVVMALSFAAAAVGAALAPAVDRAARGSVAAASAGLAGLGALAVGALAAAPDVVLGGAACVAFYLTHSAGWPLRKRLLHQRVPAGQRATTLSALSLALMLGGIAGSLLVPRLASAAGLSLALGVATVPLLLTVVLSLRLPAARSRSRAGGPGKRARRG